MKDEGYKRGGCRGNGGNAGSNTAEDATAEFNSPAKGGSLALGGGAKEQGSSSTVENGGLQRGGNSANGGGGGGGFYGGGGGSCGGGGGGLSWCSNYCTPGYYSPQTVYRAPVHDSFGKNFKGVNGYLIIKSVTIRAPTRNPTSAPTRQPFCKGTYLLRCIHSKY